MKTRAALIALVFALPWAVPARAQPSFGVRTEIAVGSLPRSIALTDLDLDGHLDLVVACEGESFLGVFLGNGNGTFGPRLEIPTADSPRALAVADWNSDGNPDILLYASGVMGISSYLGQGDGTFLAGPAVDVPGAATRIVPRDLDGDGVLDLTVSTDFGVTRLFTLKGAGGGAFGARADLDSLGGSQSYDLAIGQFVGAGPPGLFLPLACGTCPSHYFRGLGGGAFAAPLAVSGVDRPHGVLAVDLTGDGIDDVVVTEPGSTYALDSGIRILRSRGDGTFDIGPLFRTGKGASPIALGPWGTAGETDLVVGNGSYSSVSIVRVLCDGVARGLLTTQVGGQPVDVKVGDVDEDGTADIVTANQNTGTVSILRVLPATSSYLCGPIAAVTPSQLDFGSGFLDSVAVLSVTVQNTGTTGFEITGGGISGSNEFEIASPTFPAWVLPARSVSVAVRYRRQVVGTSMATLNLTTSDPAHPSFAIPLQGMTRRPGPLAGVTPLSIDFGTGLVGTGDSRNVTLSNTGTGNLLVSAVSMSDSAFVLSSLSTPFTLAPHSSLLLTVTYPRAHRGASAGILSFSTNDSTQLQLSVSLAGNAVPRVPVAQFDRVTLNFGSAYKGNAATLPLKLTNAGSASLDVSTVRVEGSEFTFAGPPGPFSLAPGSSAFFTVRYARSILGDATGVFHATSNDSLTPDATVSLTGSAQPTPAIEAVSPPRPTLTAGASTVVAVKVRNTGPGILTFTTPSTGTDLVETSPLDAGTQSTPVIRIDPGGGSWDVRGNGSIGRGTTGEYAGGMTLFPFPSFGSATLGLGGREIRLGPATFTLGLQCTRKVFVPADRSFARFVEVIANPGDYALTYTVDVSDTVGFTPGGAVLSSSGTGSYTTQDNWVVFPPDDVPARRATGRVSATVGALQRPTSSSYVLTFAGVTSRVRYALSLPPHGRAVVVEWALQGETASAAAAEASALAMAPAFAFTGMAAIDRAALWNAPPMPAIFRTTPASFQLASGDSVLLDVICDAAAATQAATIDGTLRILSNDPVHPVLSVPIGIEVTGGATISVDPPHRTDVPAPRLVLAGLAPNPASRAAPLRVAYALASDEPATLTLYDVRGRVLLTRAIAHPVSGPGWLALDRVAGTGVVWMRLTQGEWSVTRKGIFLP